MIRRGWIRGALAALLLAASGVAVAAQEAATPAPAPRAEAKGGAVRIGPADLQPLAPGRFLVQIAFAESAAPVLGPDRNTPAHQMLRRLHAAGRAAGNLGDLYENRDRGHSRLPPEAHPQLTHVLYDDALKAEGLDYGLALQTIFDAPLIGNSSTAFTAGALWRSLPRLALTDGGGALAGILFQNYASGQIHVYPEHRDHDPDAGDLLPANTPYYLISQGSSGSDQPHLEALAMILAAFRPETKAFLRETGLIAPTVQMVYRRARVGVRSRAAYLSGAAHPSVFRASDIDLVRMVGLANALTPETVPPMVRLRMIRETGAREGVDYFGPGERLFDTPSAIARIWRARTGRRVFEVSAEDTRDPNGRDLGFDWVLLRGDPDRVTIEPLSPDGARARITLDWQEPRPAPGSPDTRSARIDIGVFAGNGVHDSAPAFLSVLLSAHERREYAPAGAGGAPAVLEIDRAVPEGVYADPLLFPRMPWRDDYRHDAAGRFAGWTRNRADGTARDYDAFGRRILSRDARGNPAQVEEVRYLAERDGQGIVHLREEPPVAGEKP
jgi:hypothetical protein